MLYPVSAASSMSLNKENTINSLDERCIKFLNASLIVFGVSLIICPWLELFIGLGVLLTSIFCVVVRLFAWQDSFRATASYTRYLTWSAVSGLTLVLLPILIHLRLIGWPAFFFYSMFGIVLWSVLSARFSFRAKKRYCVLPVICVIFAPIVEVCAFLSAMDISVRESYWSTGFLYPAFVSFGLFTSLTACATLFILRRERAPAPEQDIGDR